MTRRLHVPPARLRGPLPAAFEGVFGPETLALVHGASTRAEPFTGESRTFSFDVDVRAVPRAIRCFFCGSRLRVTTRQTRTATRGQISVSNAITMHFVGAELFSVRPAFRLLDLGTHVELSGHVDHHARLPPPLAGLAERCMAAHSERELRKFETALLQRGLLVSGAC